MSGKSVESEYVSMNIMNDQGYTPEIRPESRQIRLPPELLEAIIDQIPPDDRLSLQNCALVCHLFALRAQRILFKSIILSRPYKGFRWNVLSMRHPSRQFSTLIKGSPHLSGYVEDLEIADNAHLSFYREELSWIRQDMMLPNVISKLDNLRHLSISGNHTGNRLNFNAWREALKSAISIKCQSSLLTKISLTFVRNFPVSIFLQAPALESLYLFKSMFIVDVALPESIQVLGRPKLREFRYTSTTYYEWSSFYPWLMDYEGCVDLTSLTDLALHVDFPSPQDGIEKDIDAIAWIIRQCAGTVENLSLFYPPEAVIFAASTFLDLSTLLRLRTLSLQGSIWSPGMTGPLDHLPWLTSTVSRIPSPTQLRTLHLLCALEDSRFEWNSMLTLGNTDWKGFVSVLERLAAHAEVYVLMNISESRGKEAMSIIEDRLRGIREKGVVLQVRASLEGEEVFDGEWISRLNPGLWALIDSVE